MSVLAGLMSLIIPGTGQVYHRKYIEGTVIFSFWVLWVVLTKYFIKIELIYVLFGWLVFVSLSVLDAAIFKSKKTKEEDIQIKEFEEMKKLEGKKEEFKEKKKKKLEELSKY